MSAQTIHLVVGDTAPPLRATLANANGPQNLTGATVVMRLKPTAGGQMREIEMVLAGDPTTGVVTHDWDPSEVNEAVSYKVEFVVTFSDDTQETFPVLAQDVSTIAFRALKTA